MRDIGYGVNDDATVRALARMNAKYVLAKVAVITWTKAMKKAKEGVDLTTEEALKVFTTLMVQHTKKGRSAIEVKTETGVFYREDGTTYEKTIFSAKRCFNYFLDLCGDGLFLLGVNEPNFPKVAESVINATKAKKPDIEKAQRQLYKELACLDTLASKIEVLGSEAVLEQIEYTYVAPEAADPNYGNDYILDDDGGNFWLSDDTTVEEPSWMAGC